MVDLRLEFHLPGLTISADKVSLRMPRRSGKRLGPFLIVSRASGLAIDTGHASESERAAIGWPAHSERQQLWHLEPAGANSEVVIKSADTGLVLEYERDHSDPHVLMTEADGEPWQSWFVRPMPDGVGHTIQSAHSRHYMATSMEATRSIASGGNPWPIWFEPRTGKNVTQWVILQAIGAINSD